MVPFLLVLGACEQLRTAGAAPQAAAPKPITEFPILPFDEAVAAAANELFNAAVSSAGTVGPTGPRPLAIDPLIDAATGAQLLATRSMGARIADLARENYPQLQVRPFTSETIAQSPLVLIGTLTGIDEKGEAAAAGRDAYRIWLTLLDLRSGTIVAKARARARLDTVDITPTPQFRDSPAWSADPARAAYVETCHKGKVGGPIPREYLDGILAAALASDAVEAYDAGRYQEALDLYLSARSLPGGDQLRVYNGIYLANWKLGRRDAAAAAFDDVVDFGLKARQLAVKFLFRPGSTAFWTQPEESGAYDLWLDSIARRAALSDACIEIIGHASRTGPEPLNERLSLLRAETIKRRLEGKETDLGKRMVTHGVGSRENLVGTGTDDALDALDRRVEFKPIGC
jgi:outer membrane protein OmpA-like peptidoglycan-associated protein